VDTEDRVDLLPPRLLGSTLLASKGWKWDLCS
jgi:hypothetical protein